MAVISATGRWCVVSPPFACGCNIEGSEAAGVRCSGGGDKGACCGPVRGNVFLEAGKGAGDGTTPDRRDFPGFGGVCSAANSCAAALVGNDLRSRVLLGVTMSTCHELRRLRMGM